MNRTTDADIGKSRPPHRQNYVCMQAKQASSRKDGSHAACVPGTRAVRPVGPRGRAVRRRSRLGRGALAPRLRRGVGAAAGGPAPRGALGAVGQKWLWVKNGYRKWNPGKWRQRLEPRNASSLILSHTQVSRPFCPFQPKAAEHG